MKRFSSLLLVLVFMSFSIFASWSEIELTDEFGDPNKTFVLLNYAQGTYINDDFDTKDCFIRFIVQPSGNEIIKDKWSLDSLRIELFDENMNIRKPLNKDCDYTLKIKDQNNVIHTYELSSTFVSQFDCEILNLISQDSIKIIISLNDVSYLFKFDGSNLINALTTIQQNSIKNNIPKGSYDVWERKTYNTYLINLFESIDYELAQETINTPEFTLTSNQMIDDNPIFVHMFLYKDDDTNRFKIECRLSSQTSYDDIFYFPTDDVYIVNSILFNWNSDKLVLSRNSQYEDYGYTITPAKLLSMSKAETVNYTVNYSHNGNSKLFHGSFSGTSLQEALTYF